ncbi:phoenix [Lates calcarifer]|uniref:Phoenix n=1 Tax=Lates calcarifer TaxID=8187 RepID=A0AAJ7Q685_LATCA|nr:phoenix [Lates calcarifer]
MTGERNSLNWTQSNAIVEALSAESCHIVLETSPPDYVEKISRYLKSSVRQSSQDKIYNEPAEAESDSGDSLFITQKAVPEAVRSGRRHRYSLRSNLTSPGDVQESEDDTSSSSSHRESKTGKTRKRKKTNLPKYSFPFLTEGKRKPRSTLLSVRQNAALHNHTMGGFFKCVRELWQGYQKREDLASSLPTVDMEGEYISPLSEEEEEMSEFEDIKVVERRCFVAPSKTKCSQPWYTPEMRDSQVKQQRRRTGRQKMSGGRQKRTLHKIPAKAFISRATLLSSDTESSDSEDPSDRVVAQRETSDKRVTSDRSILAQTETPTTKRRLTRGKKKILFQEKEREKELCDDSDATLCELLEPQGRPGEDTLKLREVSPDVTEPRADVFHTDDLSQTGQAEDEPESQSLLQSLPDFVSDTNNDRVQNETRVEKKKKAKRDHEGVEEGEGQSQEEPEGLRATAAVNMEAEQETEDNRVEPPAPQTSDEPQLNGENWTENLSHGDVILRQEERHVPDSKQMKKKRKMNKSAADDVRREEDGNLESEVRLETCDTVNYGKKKKKKKRKRGVEDDEAIEQLQSSAVFEPPNDEAEASQETLEASNEKKRKKDKKKLQSVSHDEAQVGAEGGVDLSSSNDVSVEGSTGQSVKTKKKNKKSKRGVEDDEGVGQLQPSAVSELLNDEAETQRNKKRERKEKRIVNMEECEEEEALNATSDVPQIPKEQSEETGNCLENTEASNEKQRKKHKKKQQSVSHDEAQVGAEGGVDLSSSNDVTMEGSSGQSVKKKKKKRESISEGMDNSSTPDKNKMVENADDSQETEERPDDQDAECLTKKKKKKKKKKSELFSSNVSEETVAQSDDSVSVQKKGKNRTSSFLVADAEEKDAQTHKEQTCPRSQSVAMHVSAEKPGVSAGNLEADSAEIAGNLEASDDGVRKKKRKRKTSVMQESVEKDHEQDFEEPRQSGLSETAEAGVKEKKKSKRNESKWVTPVERLDNAFDGGHSQSGEAVVLKKKKKKKKREEEQCHVTEESPATATDDAESEAAALKTCSSVSHKKKATKETLNVAESASQSSETAGILVLTDMRDKKKNKKKIKATGNVLLDGAESAEIETSITKKKEMKERNKPITVPSLTSSSPVSSDTSLSIKKKKQIKKRRLHNTNEDFLSDC